MHPPDSAERGQLLNRFGFLIGGIGIPSALLPSLCAGAGGAALSVACGAFLKSQVGGGEPLMAVFPILMIVCLRWGALASWISLVGGMVGAWYVYLGQAFSFVVSPNEVRALITAMLIGALIIGVCVLLRASVATLRLSNSETALLADGLAKRTEELDHLNANLRQALIEREQAQGAVALSEVQFRASFERAAVGKVQTDPATGRIIRANRAFAHMLGYEPEDLIGRSGWDFTFDEDLAEDTAEYESTLNGARDVYIREKRYVRRNGEIIWGRVSATVMRSPENGDPVLTIAVVENIDEQYKAKVALVAAKSDLEQMLAERTAALTQRDLLLREVYHRVKNNLQIIDSLLVMQSRNLADPEAKAALKGLRSRVFALGLVHHQLMGSHDLETFDIAPFLTELSENVLQGGAAKGVKLSVQAAPLTVGLDFAIPLGLIVTELVTNSLKHAFPQGEGAIGVSLDQLDDGAVVLVVSDDGQGAQGDKTTLKARTSLGTTIIDGLVQQMGGRLTVTRDNGTRSEIRLKRPVTA
jgi:PAS domain S-box-containing protein